jgi:hypothetical protein
MDDVMNASGGRGGRGRRGRVLAPLDLLGASGPTLNQMLVVKAAYCGLLGFALAR